MLTVEEKAVYTQQSTLNKNGEPTQIASDGGFFEKITPSEGKPYYLWHRNKTVEYLTSLGVNKSGVSEKEATLETEARKLAKSYLEAQKLDDEGSKLGGWLLLEKAYYGS